MQAAQFLNSIGVAAFALKYRLPGEPNSPYTKENVRQDAYRAMRLVRSRASEWNIDPHRVGILGFSAGGEVASMIAYAPGAGDPSAPDPIDRLNGKPDFQMLVYPGGGVPDTVPPMLRRPFCWSPMTTSTAATRSRSSSTRSSMPREFPSRQFFCPRENTHSIWETAQSW